MKLSVVAGALLFAASSVAAVPMVRPPTFTEGHLAPLYVSNESETLADNYIVVLKETADSDKVLDHTAWLTSLILENQDNTLFSEWLHPESMGIRHVYNMPKLKGYSGRFGKEILEIIRRSDDVSK